MELTFSDGPASNDGWFDAQPQARSKIWANPHDRISSRSKEDGVRSRGNDFQT